MIHGNENKKVEGMVNRGEGELLGRDASRSNGQPAVIRSGESGAPPVDLLPVDRGASATVPLADTGNAHTGLSDAPDLVGLLKALRRRWWLAVVGGLVCASPAAAVVYFGMSSPKYTTSALIHVAENRPREMFETRESGVGFRTYQETQAILIKSRTVLEAALSAPEVVGLPIVFEQPDPVVWLSEQIKVDFPRGSEILNISMLASYPPRDLATLLNSVVDAYLSQIVEKEQLERLERLERLKGLFATYQNSLKEKRQEFREKADSTGTSDKQAAAVQQQMMIEHLGLARQELLRLQGDIRRSKARLNVLASRVEKVAPYSSQDFTPPELVTTEEADPEVFEIQGRIADLKRQQASLMRLARKGSADPSFQAMQRQIRQLNKALETHRRELRADAAKRGPTSLADAHEPATDGRVRDVEEYLEILREQEKSLAGEIAELESQMSSLNVKSMDLRWLEDEIAVVADTARMVGSEVQSMTVELQAPSRIRLIERASVPTLVDPRRRYKYTAMAGLVVFLAFVGLVSFWEFRTRKVDAPNEVVDRVGLRVIGGLPIMGGRSGNRQKLEERDRWVQSIDAVRTMLLSAGRFQSFQVVMVGSALKGEGKTSLSCHLATSLARAGRRTLLIDCDLRKPSLHKIFDFPQEPGLCEILRGEVGWTDAIRGAPARDLSLMLAGHLDSAAIEMLPRNQFADILQELRQEFEFIVIDTSPILQVTDSLIISQNVDAVLFSVLREVSQLPQIHAAFERLNTMGVRILGAVVAGVPGTMNHNYGTYGSSRP
jgi:capsular exopolysaccharide synthesis family protein